MKKYPAIALLELTGIATGLPCADKMIKRAPITVIKSGTVHDGKFLILVGGSVASVEEAYYEGLGAADGQVLDRVFLPDIHPEIHDALLGKKSPCTSEAVGIIETSSVAATLQSADAAIKGAEVNVVEIRVADDLGGKAFAIFSGTIEDVQIALSIAREKTTREEFWIQQTIIPRIHTDLARQIDQSTTFHQLDLHALEGGEI